jgi:hypothetical protein
VEVEGGFIGTDSATINSLCTAAVVFNHAYSAEEYPEQKEPVEGICLSWVHSVCGIHRIRMSSNSVVESNVSSREQG